MSNINTIIYSFSAGVWTTIASYHLGKWSVKFRKNRPKNSKTYISDLGVSWCILHNGVCNEDSDQCDAFDWLDTEEMMDEDGEYLPCDLRPLAYVVEHK